MGHMGKFTALIGAIFFKLFFLGLIILVVVLIISNRKNNSNQEARTYKKLTRSLNNRYMAGVCGGLGEYFGWDPNLIRVIFVVLGASMALPYIVLALILPVSSQYLDHR